MIDPADFVAAARARHYDFYTGVPCSILTPFIDYVCGAQGLDYLPSANEGDAVATAAGAWIGGRGAVAMMQNSGLGNAISPLTSLTATFGIPVLIICTHRGAPGSADEPQHALMGQITGALFDTIRVPWTAFPRTRDAIEPGLVAAAARMAKDSGPFAFVMPKGACTPGPAPVPASAQPRSVAATVGGQGHGRPGKQRASRQMVLERVVEQTSEASTVVVATTGYTGRELYAIADRPNHLYVVGSMGCASSLGLGLALARPDLKVLVLDGDGAALMRMGNLATIGARGPANLTHVVLDNEIHESTGAQATVSATTDFAGVALACGYASVTRTDDPEELSSTLHSTTGPTFIHLKIRPGIPDRLPRPAASPRAVLERLREHIAR